MSSNAIRTGEENELGVRESAPWCLDATPWQLAVAGIRSKEELYSNWTGTLCPRFELWLQVLLPIDRQQGRTERVFILVHRLYSLRSSLFANDFRKWNVESFRLTSKRVTYSLRLVKNLVDFVLNIFTFLEIVLFIRLYNS